jgi:predicted TIM-barrel enzyme
MHWNREEIVSRFRKKIAAGQPIVGAGAGTGISAKCAEQGGADLMAGRGSLSGLLAYGNANQIVIEMGHEVLTIVEQTPVIAGVNGTDPFLLLDPFFRQLREMGFAGVQNFPTVGLIDGTFRANLEETGMGFGKEVSMIAAAHAAGLLTTPYVFDEEQARQMARAGADIIVAHMGLTTGGQIGAKTAMNLDAAAVLVNRIIDAARSERSDVIVLCHGGPISSPEDVSIVLGKCPAVNGFFGATSMERLPAEVAITEQVRKFTSLSLKK